MAFDPTKFYNKDDNGKYILSSNVLLPAVYNSEQYKLFYQKNYESTGNVSPRDIESITKDVIEIYGFENEKKQGIQAILQTLPSYFFTSDFINNVDLRPLFKAYEGKYIIGKYKSDENRQDDDSVPKQINSGTFVDKITNQFKDTYETELEGSSEAKLKNTTGWSPSAKTTNGGIEPGTPSDTLEEPLDSGDVPDLEDNYAYNYKEYLDTYLGTSIQDLMQLQDTANPAIPSGGTQSFSKSSFDELTGTVTVKSYTSDIQGKYEEYTDSRIAAETNTVMGAGTEVKYNLRQAIQYTSTLDDKQLRELQQMLKVNGYYQNEKNSQFILGENDELTRTAWNRFLTDVLRSEMSPAEFAKKNADKLKKRLESGEFVTEYSDSLMESMADQWGTQMLGRKLNASETKGLALAVRQWDIQNTKDSFYNNPNDGSTVEDDVYSYLMEEYEVEQNQNNMSDTFASMKRVLG